MAVLQIFQKVTLGIGLALAPITASAEDLALIVSNQAYDGIEPLATGAAAAGLSEDLRARGWSVFSATDAKAGEMRAMARKLQLALKRSGDSDRVLIVLTGLMVETDRDAWLLEAGRTRPDSFNVGGLGLSLGALADLAAQAPGKAVLIVGLPRQAPEPGAGVRAFSGAVDLPQGVTLVAGPMGGLRRWTRDVLLTPGTSFGRALGALPTGAEASGFSSNTQGFSDGTDPGAGSPQMGEMAYWNAVGDIGTEAGYRAYLERYPDGIFADDAKARLAALTLSPRDKAAQAEAALKLNRNARRQIQRNLDLLGFDPRGIDGVFGRGSRAAIAAWQRNEGQEDSGFMTARQVAMLQRQADIRAAELEREAQLRREAEERADREFWQQLGRDEASLRAYLKRYPDGLFAGNAQAQLDRILADRRDEAEAQERAAWDAARNVNNIRAYNSFLRSYPNGAFAEEARQRIRDLQQEAQNADQLKRLEQIEAQMVPNKGARLLVERILAARGLNPGPVDGAFSRETRRALRRFQKAQGLPVNGYVTQKTMVVLMLSNR